MKLVRESINEIKQHIEGSGLGSIGVGASTIYKAYNIASKIDSNLKNYETLDTAYMEIEEVIENDELLELKQKISNLLDAPLQHIIMVSVELMSDEVLNYAILQTIKYTANTTNDDIIGKKGTDIIHITTNKNMGISYVGYKSEDGIRKNYFCFRKP